MKVSDDRMKCVIMLKKVQVVKKKCEGIDIYTSTTSPSTGEQPLKH